MNECLIEYPYKHFISSSFFDEVDFGVLHNNLNLLEWELYRKQSYEYWISSLDYNCDYYKVTKQIIDKVIDLDFIKNLSALFNSNLNKCKDASFHKMEAGHYSKRHTDENDTGEKVRIVIYFSEISEYTGGELVIYSENTDNAKINEYKFTPNSAFGFLMSDKSFHEAKLITKGTRICLVLTYI